MNTRLLTVALWAMALAPALQTASCIGSETNWLDGPDDPTLTPAEPEPPRKPELFEMCFLDEDCAEGSCLCGLCTVACSTSADCPVAESSCALGDGAGYF